jgi:hypothetical protein
MGLDIRTPIGLMFATRGAAHGYGLGERSPIYERSLGNNINLGWGLVLLLFGGVMLWLGRVRRAGPRSS